MTRCPMCGWKENPKDATRCANCGVLYGRTPEKTRNA